MYYLYKKDDCLGICKQGSGLYEHIIYKPDRTWYMEWTGYYPPFNGEIIGITKEGIKQFHFEKIKRYFELSSKFDEWAKKHLMDEYQIDHQIELFKGQQYMKI